MAARQVIVSRVRANELVQAELARLNALPDARWELTVLRDGEQAVDLWWAWVVPVCTVDFARTRDFEDMLVGMGPYLVDKFTGELISTGSGSRLHPIERARGYRPWWKFWGPNWLIPALATLQKRAGSRVSRRGRR